MNILNWCYFNWPYLMSKLLILSFHMKIPMNYYEQNIWMIKERKPWEFWNWIADKMPNADCFLDKKIYYEYEYEFKFMRERWALKETKTLSDDNQHPVHSKQHIYAQYAFSIHIRFVDFCFLFSLNSEFRMKPAHRKFNVSWFEFHAVQAHVFTNFQWFDGI